MLLSCDVEKFSDWRFSEQCPYLNVFADSWRHPQWTDPQIFINS